MARKKNEFSILDRIADTLEGMASGERKSTASAITKLGMLNRIADALDEIAESGSGGGGSGGGMLMIGYSSYEVVYGTGTLDHTWQEIYDAMASGRLVILSHEPADEAVYHEILKGCSVPGDNEYKVSFMDEDFVASSPDGYPSNISEGDIG